jgi:hypothetical protein
MPRGLHGVVVADHPPADGHAERRGQAAEPPGVLGGDDVRARERVAQPR